MAELGRWRNVGSTVTNHSNGYRRKWPATSIVNLQKCEVVQFLFEC